MLDNESDQTPESTPPTGTTAAPPDAAPQPTEAPAKKTARKAAAKKTAKKATAKRATKKAAPPPPADTDAGRDVPEAAPAGEEARTSAVDSSAVDSSAVDSGAVEFGTPATGTAKKTAKKTAAKKTTKKAPAKKATKQADPVAAEPAPAEEAAAESTRAGSAPPAASMLFQPPDPVKAEPRKRTRKKPAPAPQAESPKAESPKAESPQAPAGAPVDEHRAPEPKSQDEVRDDGEPGEGDGTRRRRRRGGRRRRKGGQGDDAQGDTAQGSATTQDDTEATQRGDGSKAKQPDGKAADSSDSDEQSAGTRRRRRRRRSGDTTDGSPDDPANTVVRVREPRKSSDDEISGFTGSTRLEAKKQRRREGREAGRRRPPIVSEAEFLARRESVDRTMVVRQHADLTQIAVLEDKLLVEHYVARESQTSMIGNVYLGRVQNVLPSMEAAFIDIGKGRNAVLYAGEVNWAALGKDGQPRRIETALKSGQPVLVQVTKDPVGHKGARLTSQISLPGRYLVYVPGGQTSGISRKLPDTERNRLKNLLKEIIPDEAGVIIRTAAEGASEEELRRDVARLTARWEDIEKKVEAGHAPALLYGEPDLTVKVVRDLFTEDFDKLVVSGDDAWDTIEGYVGHVAPDLMERVERWDGDSGSDVFASYRVDEQIAKGLDRKVFLPSGGSLVIDRTEAMTVVDVNTGKFTGSGGNLEETVTKNNLEAAEEIVRQLRLRDIGGIIVVDFIDMVLESNRDLVLRRLVECLGRDRTKHQVAEVTSLGLVQMTRKRIGTGLLEAFSESCEHCGGRGLIVHHEPVEPKKSKRDDDEHRRGKRGRRHGGNGEDGRAQDKPKDQPKAQREEPPKEQPQPRPEDKAKPVQGQPTDQPAGRSTLKPDDTAPKDQHGGKVADAVATEAGEPSPPAPAEEVKPKRTRRRAARPQGEPAEQPTVSEPASDVSERPVSEPTTSPAPAPDTAPPQAPETTPDTSPSAAPAQVPAATTEPVATGEPVATTEPAPRRTRRRAASRPAGPPQ